MKAINSRKPWAMSELRFVFQQRAAGVSVATIAGVLGRSTWAIYGQLNIADFTSSDSNDTRSMTSFKLHKRNIKAAMSCND